MAKDSDIGGFSFEGIGLLLRVALLRGRLRIGCVAQITKRAASGSGGTLQADLSPLPSQPPTAETARLLRAMKGGATLALARLDLCKTVKRAGRASWIFRVVVAVNFLHCGLSPPDGKLAGIVSWERATATQRWSLDYIGKRVDAYLDTEEKVPKTAWATSKNRTSKTSPKRQRAGTLESIKVDSTEKTETGP